jgi:hypothetical protein
MEEDNEKGKPSKLKEIRGNQPMRGWTNVVFTLCWRSIRLFLKRTFHRPKGAGCPWKINSFRTFQMFDAWF